ncbi:Replication factor C subunit 5, partial [Intoshia linei]
MLWADQHRPIKFDSMILHRNIHDKLKSVAQDNCHLLFHGANGSGRHTLVKCLLRQIFGSQVEKVRIDSHEFKTPSNKTVEIETVSSNHHIVVNPSEAGIHDRVVVQELIKTMAKSRTLNIGNSKKFNVVVINDAQTLSFSAQNAMRRTMERYMGTCRIFFVTNSLTMITSAVQSRCFIVRVPSPNQDEFREILTEIFAREKKNIKYIDKFNNNEFIDSLMIESDYNLRKAILMAEAANTT